MASARIERERKEIYLTKRREYLAELLEHRNRKHPLDREALEAELDQVDAELFNLTFSAR